MSQQSRARRTVPFLIAMTAGFATLAFQIVCLRLLMQHFGSGATAIASMVAVSLLGLAAGAYFFGQFADHRPRPIAMAAKLLLLTGVFVLLASQFHGSVAEQIDALLGKKVNGLGAHQLLFCCAVAFLVNTFLGGILPLLVSCESTDNRLGFAPVYAGETAGALTGSLLTGFVLIPIVGTTYSLICIAAVCVIAAVIGWISQSENNLPSVAKINPTQPQSRPSPWLLLVVLLASCSSLGMEVIWQRYFVIFFGSDTHSLAIVTAAFFVGVFAGALIASRLIERAKDRRQTLYAICLTAAAVATLVSTWMLSNCVDGRLALWINESKLLTAAPVASRFLVAIATLLLPSLLFGIGLPIAAELWWSGKQTQQGRKTGEIYGTAILGNVLGVLGVGFVLIPMIGLSKSALVLSAMCFSSGLVAFLVLQSSGERKAKPVLVAVAALSIGWAFLAYRLTNDSVVLGVHADKRGEVLFYQESGENTVAVVGNPEQPEQRRMLIDGVIIGESGGGVDEKQQLLAHLPFVLRPGKSGENVLTIGLGSGMLCGELLKQSRVKSATVIELSKAVIEAAEYFADLNGDVLSHDKLRIVQADGLRFLNACSERYDVIISDGKSRPGHAGNVAFFSADYYRDCEAKLTTDGLFVQWIGLNTSRPAIEVILNSFCDTFEFGHVAIAAPNSLFLVGTNRPLQIDPAHIQRYLDETTTSSLADYHWNSADDFLSLYWLDQAAVASSFIGDQAINSIELPSLETFALESFDAGTSSNHNRQLTLLDELIRFDAAGDTEDTSFNGNALSGGSNSKLQTKLLAGRSATRRLIRAAVLMNDLGDDWLDLATAEFKLALNKLPELSRQGAVVSVFRQLAESARGDNRIDAEFSALDNVSQLKLATADEEFRLGEILSGLEQDEKALDYYFRAASKAPDRPRFRCEFGFGLLKLKRLGQAKSQFSRVLRERPENAAASLGSGISELLSGGQREEAMLKIQAAIAKQPNLEQRLNEFGLSYDSL